MTDAALPPEATIRSLDQLIARVNDGWGWAQPELARKPGGLWESRYSFIEILGEDGKAVPHQRFTAKTPLRSLLLLMEWLKGKTIRHIKAGNGLLPTLVPVPRDLPLGELMDSGRGPTLPDARFMAEPLTSAPREVPTEEMLRPWLDFMNPGLSDALRWQAYQHFGFPGKETNAFSIISNIVRTLPELERMKAREILSADALRAWLSWMESRMGRRFLSDTNAVREAVAKTALGRLKPAVPGWPWPVPKPKPAPDPAKGAP